MSVYRTSAEIEATPSAATPRCGDRIAAGSGYIVRGCSPPGFWSRLFNGVGGDARWHCDCGAIFKWYVNHWSLEKRGPKPSESEE